MAKRVDNIEFKKHPRSKYNWDEWTDGSTWLIEQGEDFDASVVSMKGHIYSHAFKNNRKVRVRTVSETAIAFQFFTPDEA
jgi:hypothetical protein